MQGTTPTIHCDAEDGSCGAWDVDYYSATVSTIDGIPVTRTERAPGWTSTGLEDYCPEHNPLSRPGRCAACGGPIPTLPERDDNGTPMPYACRCGRVVTPGVSTTSGGGDE